MGLGHRSLSGYMHIRLAAASICVLAAGVSCPAEKVQKPVTTTADVLNHAENHDDVVLFFTGSTLGALKPCGCSGGQLGGLEKRKGIFDDGPKTGRMIIDTGALVQSDREQEIIKFRVLFEAFRLLGYDVVHLTAQDVETAGNLGVLTDGDRPFGVISASGQGTGVSRSFTRQLTVEGHTISVNVTAFDAQAARIDQATRLFPDGDAARTVNVLILQGCEGSALQDILSAMPPTVDCVVYPSDSDEPRVLSQPGARPLVFTVGRFGRHISRVSVTIPPQKGRLALQFADVPVGEKLAEDEALVRLYRSYQQLVRESRLLEKYPRIPLPDGLTFTGSADCARCHEYEYELWSTKPHADALAVLKKVGSDRDPECVICHVVGMEYAEGFITEEQTPHLKDVGCEVCHGPGSAHAQAPKEMVTTEPQMNCLDCHTPEHSGEYAGHEEEFMKKIVHWREP